MQLSLNQLTVTVSSFTIPQCNIYNLSADRKVLKCPYFYMLHILRRIVANGVD